MAKLDCKHHNVDKSLRDRNADVPVTECPVNNQFMSGTH